MEALIVEDETSLAHTKQQCNKKRWRPSQPLEKGRFEGSAGLEAAALGSI